MIRFSVPNTHRLFVLGLPPLVALAMLTVLLGVLDVSRAAQAAPPAPAATITVNTTTDELNTDGDCSLREAIQAANLNVAVDACPAGSGVDTINIPAGTYILSIAGAGENANATGDLDITSTATLQGAGALTTILSANGLDRVLHATGSAALRVSGLTVRDGYIPGSSGGGILASTTLDLANARVISNAAPTAGSSFGGGLYVAGIAYITSTTIMSNFSGGNGGGFSVNTLVMSNTTVLSNTAAFAGGGGESRFTSTGADLIHSSTFQNNRANAGGAGGFLHDSANGSLTVNASAFISNAATTENADDGGGGVYSRASTNTVDASRFISNVTDQRGGGAYLRVASTVRNTLFVANMGGAGMGLALRNNAAHSLLHNTFVSPTQAGGAAVYILTGTTTFQNNIVVSHTTGVQFTGTLTEDYNLFFGNATNLLGGLPNSGGHSFIAEPRFVSVSAGNYHLSNSSLAIDNAIPAGVTTDGDGDPRPLGGRYDIGYDEYTGAYAPITGLSATNNGPKAATANVAFTATIATGTGVQYVWNFGDGVTATGRTPSHAYAVAGIYTATVTGTNPLSSASANTLVTIVPLGPITVTTTADELNNDGDCSLREAVQAANTNAVVDACPPGGGWDTIVLAANTYTLTRVGAGEDANATGDLDSIGDLTIRGVGENVTVINANALDRALHSLNSNTTLLLRQLQVFNGAAASGGGGVYANGALALDRMRVYSNSTSSGDAGGVYVAGTSAFTQTTFSSNVGAANGGAAHVGVATLSYVTFTNNLATFNGGGLFVRTNGVQITGGLFQNNRTTANGWGGGLYISGGILSGTTFISNAAPSAAANTGGGGLFGAAGAGSGPVTLNNVTFLSNTTTQLGGGALLAAAGNLITNVTAIANTAGLGGGGLALGHNSGAITGGYFARNSAGANGGGFASGVITGGGGGSLSGTVFVSNTAAAGGGAYLNRSTTLTNLQVLNNVATGVFGGGGLFLTQGNFSLQNSLFVANAGSAGAAVYGLRALSSTTLLLAHNTIVGPSPASRSALHFNSGGQSMANFITNTILASYTVGLESFNVANTVVQENHNLYSGVAQPFSGTITAGANSITATPSFINAAAGNYHLASTSEAVDAGTNAGVSVDFDGEARPLGDGFDIGYDEVPATPISGLSASNSSPTFLGSATFFTATLSSGTNATYAWNFGDQSPIANLQFPSHIYATIGTFTATVTATNSLNSATATTWVTVVEQPISGLSASNSSPTPLGSATFFTVTLSAGSSVTYTWDFGDQSPISNLQSPSHIYSTLGTYTATVTATNSLGHMVANTVVTIVDQAIADLNATNSSPTPLGSATFFTATLGNGTNVSYTWDFGDQSPVSNLQSPSHTYSTTGTYTATVTATNSINSLSVTTVVSVTPLAPPAGLSLTTSAPTLLGNAIYFTATLTSGSPPVTYTWDFGDSNSAIGAVTTHTYNTLGTYTVSVTATNSLGEAVATTLLTIAERPIAGLSASNSGPTRFTDPTFFTATIGDGSNVTYTWDFGDQSPISNLQAPAHTYATTGTFTAVVTATNSVGSVMTTTLVTVTNARPLANAGADHGAFSNQTVSLDGTGSSDPDNHLPLTYTWTQLSGPTVTLSSATNVTPTFTAPSVINGSVTLSFQLVVTDSTGFASAADAVTVTVSAYRVFMPFTVK